MGHQRRATCRDCRCSPSLQTDRASVMTASAQSDTARAAEEDQLADIQARLQHGLREAGDRLTRYAQDVKDQTTYLWENRAAMEHGEQVAYREYVERSSA